MKKVSVIVPCYNKVAYVRDCLKSLVNQTLIKSDELEIILINDHSNDGTERILEEYAKMYPKVIELVQLQDVYGPSAARNMGLDVAKGDYIGFVDCDDVVSTAMYKTFYETIEKYGVSIVSGNYTRESNSSLETTYGFISSQLLKTQTEKMIFLCDRGPIMCNKLFKKELFDNYRFKEDCIYEDLMSYPLYLRNEKTVHFFDPCYFYRQTPNSIMDSILLPSEHIVDAHMVSLQAYEYGKMHGFSKGQMANLERYLNIHSLKKICAIRFWQNFCEYRNATIC